MNNLTINLMIENADDFFDKNMKEIKKIVKKSGVKIQICTADDLSKVKKVKDIIYIKSNGNEYLDFNELLQNTTSEYVLFYNDNNMLFHKVIERVNKELEAADDLAYIQPMCKRSKLHEAKEEAGRYSKKEWIEFSERKKNKNLLYFNRYVLKTNWLKKMYFTESQKKFYKDMILLSLMEQSDGIKILNTTAVYTEEPLEDNINSYSPQFKKEWYTEYFEDFIIPYMKTASINAHLQQMIMYLIELRFYFNMNARDKFVLEGEEIDEFFATVKKVLLLLEDEYIVETCYKGCLAKIFSYLFMKMKYGKVTISTKQEENDILYYLNGMEVGKNRIGTVVKAINYRNHKLYIDCEIKGSCLIQNIEKRYDVLVNGEKVEVEKTHVYNISKSFGKSIYRFSTFQFVIPESMMNKTLAIEFKLNLDDITFVTPLSFETTSSRLTNSKSSYFKFANHIISTRNNNLIIKKAKWYSVFYKEVRLIYENIKMRKKLEKGMSAAKLRVYYWLTRRKYSDKPNWIFFDKLYKAGDNAEYLFDYCYNNKKDVNSYYIVNKDAIDYERLKEKYGSNILEFNSVRQKTVVLNADTIFATHALALKFCGFDKNLQSHLKNLLRAKIVCIQHGLTIQSIAQYQNRLQDNTDDYFCASKYEIENLKQPIYGYHNSQLHLTGCPRYDGLVNNDQRQILIAPTWRRNIVITGNAVGTSKSYNPEFKNTKYFEIYNSLINDERLLKAVKEFNYKLVFLIHPTLSSQMEDFDKNDCLEIIPAVSDVSYEKMLTESSLMLTDYSGIQFDFAYMKKPILYYHSNELPPQYEEGIYKYATMGFGPIIEEYDNIVEELCSYMSEECKMDDKYVKRVEDFFEYTDHNNCKRIIDVIESNRG